MNDTEILRARIAAQGLTSAHDAVVPALTRHGFVRTLGGVDAYLALRSRVRGFHAADLDHALATREAIVMPAARGCMYVVAREHAPAALRLAAELTLPRAEKEQIKAGIEAGELAMLGKTIVATLTKIGPSSTDALRKALPKDAVRSLGDLGKKVGLSSTLPPALRLLELEGTVERTPEERLQQGSYLWQVARANLLAHGPKTKADALIALVQIYARASALVRTKAFAAWAGVPQKEAAVAIAAAALVPTTFEGAPAFLHPDARDADVSDVIALLTTEDVLFELEDGLGSLTDPGHRDVERDKFARHLLVGDRVVGLWDWSPKDGRVVVGAFASLPKATAQKVRSEAERLSAFITDELGHARWVSVENDDEVQRRADRVVRLNAIG